MRLTAAATCSFGCQMIRQPMDRLCYVDPIVIHAKPFQLILQSESVNRLTVYCGPNRDVYSSTNVRIFIPESFDNLFGI